LFIFSSRVIERRSDLETDPAKGLEIAAVIKNRYVFGNAKFSGFRYRAQNYFIACVSVSTILAALATLAGPADIARAILTSVESPLLIDEL
jgi:hypothetical protein